MPVLEIASPLLRRLGLLATFLALSRIGNFIFLPNLDYAAVAAERVSGECSEVYCGVEAVERAAMFIFNMLAYRSCCISALLCRHGIGSLCLDNAPGI